MAERLIILQSPAVSRTDAAYAMACAAATLRFHPPRVSLDGVDQ
jgi:hypothetical protein